MNNIILCGFMGAGKTSVGKELSKKLNYGFIDTDELIEKEQSITINEIFDKYGESYFRDLEYEMCKKITNEKNNVIAIGGGTITFKRNCDILKNNNTVIFLDATFDTILDRIGDSNTRPLFRDLEKAKKLYNDRKEKYINASDYIIDGNLSVEDTILKIGEILA